MNNCKQKSVPLNTTEHDILSSCALMAVNNVQCLLGLWELIPNKLLETRGQTAQGNIPCYKSLLVVDCQFHGMAAGGSDLVPV